MCVCVCVIPEYIFEETRPAYVFPPLHSPSPRTRFHVSYIYIYKALAQMMAATVAETAACLIRVPTEVVKQRMQVGLHNSAIEAVPSIIKRDGILGLYNGFGSTSSHTHTYIYFTLFSLFHFFFLKLKITFCFGAKKDDDNVIS
jgi:hypothetical protein